MTITQLATEGHGARLYEVTFVRIYSPSEVSCLKMWKGVCTFLINSEVKVLNYDPFIQPVHNVHKKTHIKFSWKDQSEKAMNCQIYRDDIIIGLCEYILHFFILNVMIAINPTNIMRIYSFFSKRWQITTQSIS